MDIVIVAQYLRNIGDFSGNNSRFVYLAKELTRDPQNSVEIITSDFYHGTKTHFESVGDLEGVKITALHEGGYPTNVCLKRFSSHKELANNVKEYLRTRKKPDLCYCAIPSLDVAEAVARYCEKNDVRFFVDIQDLWPEAFQMVFRVPVLSDLIFLPLKRQADKIYKTADQIVAVSRTYVERAMRVNRKCAEGKVVFLGTKLETFDENVKNNPVEKPSDEIWLGYCGTLGASYDITCVLDALCILQEKGVSVPKFIVMGDGPRKNEFEAYAKEKNIDAVFAGRLPYDQMCGMLSACDIAVNPITHGAAQSIINKHGDYAASGLPVLNTQECEEYRDLVTEYQMGYNCRNNDAEDLAEKMLLLLESETLRKEMGRNARRCAEERFDRKNSYGVILDLITRGN